MENPNELLSNNILSYKNTLRNMLEGWKNLTLSWWGRLALIKMKVLPGLLFLFQNPIIHIPRKYINEFQRMINRFLRKEKTTRIKNTLLQQKAIKGGIAYPSINNYYQASRLAAML